jgi:hypothetical protein
MRALSSTLSSNQITARIHSDKERLVCQTYATQLHNHINHSRIECQQAHCSAAEA